MKLPQTPQPSPSVTLACSGPTAQLKLASLVATLLLLLVASLTTSRAADGTWTNVSGGNWSDPLNWLGGIVADGAGSKADFSTLDLTAFPVVTLDSPRTIGSLVFGDTDTSSPGGWVLTNSTLTLSNSSATPLITVNAMNSIGLGFDATNDVIVLSVLAGGQGFIKKGGGTLTLANTNVMGSVQIDEGYVAPTKGTSLGTGNQEVRYNGGGLRFPTGAANISNTNRFLAGGRILSNPNPNYDGYNGRWVGSGTVYAYIQNRFTAGPGNATAFSEFAGTIDLTGSQSPSLFRINLGGGTTAISSNLYDMAQFTLNTGTNSGRFAARMQRPGTWRIGAIVGGPNTTLDGSSDSGGTLLTWEIGYLNNSATFDGQLRHFDNNAAQVAALTKVGTGKLTLTHANNRYTGNTVISNGVLALSGSGNLTFTPRISIRSGAVFDVSGRTTAWGPAIAGQTLEGSGSGVVTGDVAAVLGTISPGPGIGTLSFSNNLALTEGVTNLFEITGPGVNDSIFVAGNLTLNSSSGGVVVRAVPTGAFIPNGTYPLFKWGGSLPAGDTNSLALQYPAQSGTLTLEQNLATKQIFLKVVGVVTPANLTWRGDGGANDWDITSANWTGGGTVFKDGDNVTFDNSGSNNVPVNLAAVVSPGSTIVNASKDYVFSSTASGRISGVGSLLKTNSGRLTLTTDNDYSHTTIAGGTVQLGDGATSAGSLGTGNVTNNGVLIYNRPDDIVNATPIRGTGALVQQGSGVLTLAGNSTYSGGTTISNGSTVVVGNLGALGVGPVKLAGGTLKGSLNYSVGNAVHVSADSTIFNNSNNGDLQFDSSDISSTGGLLTLAGKGAAVGGTSPSGIRFNSGGIIYNGPIDLQVPLDLSHDGTNTFNGVISGPGDVQRRLGGGTLIVNAQNTYSGGTFFRQGQIGLGSSSVSTVPPTIDSGPIGTGSLIQDTANGNTLFAWGGARTVGNPIVLNAAGGALTLAGDNALTLSGSIDLGGANKTITANDTGKFILSGDISNGNLIKAGPNALYINGNNNAASTLINVGTLGGTGTFSGPVTVASGAALAPGASVGTLTINSDLTLAGNLAIEVNNSLSPSNDLVAVSGVLTNAGTGTVTVKNLGPALNTGDKFTLFSKPLLNGNVLTVTGAGYAWANNLAVDGSISVTGVVPPPTLNVTQVGNTLQFSWSDSFKLQAQTNALNVGISTNWFDYPGGGTSPVSVPFSSTNGSVFFRLISTF